MTTYTQALSGGNNYPAADLRLELTVQSSNAVSNTSVLAYKLFLRRGGTGGQSTFSGNEHPFALRISGQNLDGESTYDFRASSGRGSVGAESLLRQGTVTVDHAAAGGGSAAWSFSFTDESPEHLLGSGSRSGSFTLPTLKRVPNVPTSPALSRVSDTQLRGSWAQSNAGNQQPTTNEYRTRVNGGSWSSATSVSATTSTTIPTAANRKTEMQVRARNSAGASAWSSISAPAYTTPGTPTAVTATKDAALDITVKWTPHVGYTEHQHLVEHQADGGAWTALATVNAGTTSYKHSSPNPAQTHRYRVRARSTSGGLLSAWVLSPMVQLLAPPAKPTIQSLPAVVASDADWSVVWVHTPVDTTPQSAYEVGFSLDGGISWTTTGKVTATASSRTVPAGTYDPDDTVSVRVRTWGAATDPSPWSDVESVTVKSVPVASIVAPADDAVLEQAALVVEVGFAQAEGAAFVQATVTLSDASGDIETVTSGSLSEIGFETAVQDGGSYTLTATVLDSNGLVSAPVTADFTVEYTLPVAAEVVLSYLDETGWVQIDLTIPEPGAGETSAAAVSISRTIDGFRETVVTEYPVDGEMSIVDTTPTIQGENAYRIRTLSADGASVDVTASITVQENFWAYLSTGPGYGTVIRFGGDLKMDVTPGRATALVEGAGRSKPIAQFGPQRSLTVSGSATLAPGLGSTPDEVEAFLMDAALACYRDCTGRRMFGTVSGTIALPSSLVSPFTYMFTEAS